MGNLKKGDDKMMVLVENRINKIYETDCRKPEGDWCGTEEDNCVTLASPDDDDDEDEDY